MLSGKQFMEAMDDYEAKTRLFDRLALAQTRIEANRVLVFSPLGFKWDDLGRLSGVENYNGNRPWSRRRVPAPTKGEVVYLELFIEPEAEVLAMEAPEFIELLCRALNGMKTADMLTLLLDQLRREKMSLSSEIERTLKRFGGGEIR